MVLKLVEGHTMTAGVGNAVYLDANDGAGSGIGREAHVTGLQALIETWVEG